MTYAQWKRQIDALCVEMGWQIAGISKHIKLVRSGCPPVFCSQTPSCAFAIKKVKADMRRAMRDRA